MTSRRDARRVAIDILFQSDVTGAPADQVLADWASLKPLTAFTRELVAGVEAHRSEIDAVLGARSEGWPVFRMAALDRTILRVGVYELLHRPDIPKGAAISEAVEAAIELSTEDSGRFVNGILGHVARDLEQAGPT